MYFITILFDIQCYDIDSRAPSRYYNFALVILRVNISLHLEGDTVPTRWRFYLVILFSHPPKRRRVTYASTIRPASASVSASTLSTSMKPLHGIISYCTCILV